MFTKKLQYRIWKHYTKKIVSDEGARARIFREAYYQPCAKNAIQELDYKQNWQGTSPSRIICVQGYTYSGSSTLVGLFNEFDNIRMVGWPEPDWIKRKINTGITECRFFSSTRFLKLLDSFHEGTLAEQDAIIREFIYDVAMAYETKSVRQDNMSELYNDYFLKISRDFLIKALELTPETKEFMSHQRFFPYLWEKMHSWEHCNFACYKGANKFLFYRFRKMEEEEFRAIVREYLENFFSIIQGNEIIAYDWLLPQTALEKVNYYLSKPIKQVCVWRDPRDRFLSCIKTACDVPMKIEDHCNMLLTKLKNQAPSENRLVVRFEDLVLKYEETTQKVMKFLELDPSHHVAPKTIFDPSLSVVNIGAWKLYPDQEYMKALEDRFKEYCFYPEKENLSAESLALLKASGNWEELR